jgi:hypothetical protein
MPDIMACPRIARQAVLPAFTISNPAAGSILVFRGKSAGKPRPAGPEKYRSTGASTKSQRRRSVPKIPLTTVLTIDLPCRELRKSEIGFDSFVERRGAGALRVFGCVRSHSFCMRS